MKRRQYTRGPWIADQDGYDWKFDGGYNGTITSLTTGEKVFAGPASFCALRGKTEAQAQANAKLMAAAPELLEALEFLLKNFDSEKHSAKAIIMANYAIQKATE